MRIKTKGKKKHGEEQERKEREDGMRVSSDLFI